MQPTFGMGLPGRFYFEMQFVIHVSIAGRYWPLRVADGPITARCRMLGGVQSNPNPLDSSFSWEIWIKLINLRYRTYPKYSIPLFFSLHFFSTFILLHVNVCEIAG